MSTPERAPSGRERRKQVTRDDLLASAERQFIERGFHGASIDEIARAAGFTKGAVYAHFANKEELFAALTERRWDDQLERVRTALDAVAASSADQRDAGLVELTRELLWDDPDWRLLALEFTVHSARNPAARQRVAARLATDQSLLGALLERDLRNRGVTPPVDPHALAGVLLAFFNGIALRDTTSPGQDDDVLAAAIRLIELALARPSSP